MREPRMSVAVLGLGAMGGRIAVRLVEAGHRVVGWNRTHARAEELAARGAQRAETPADAVAEVDIAITMLADPEAVLDVVRLAAAGLHAGQTLVDMSTSGPSVLERVRAAAPEGIRVVDAPVLGSIAEAENGSLVIFLGADDDDASRLQPLLAALGTTIRVGPPGAGAAAKLVANSTLLGSIAVLGEAIALADRLGLDRGVAFEVLANTPVAAQAERRRPALERSNYPRRFALSLAHKDARLVVEEGAKRGAELPLALAVLEWLAKADAAGDGERDYTAVLETIVRTHHPGQADRAAELIEGAAALAHRIHARGYRWVGVYEVRDEEVAILAWSGPGPPAYPRFPRDRGLTGRAILRREAVIVNDIRDDPDYLDAFGDTRAEAIAPVILDGTVVGTLDIESSQTGAFNDDDRRFLESSAADAQTLPWRRPGTTQSSQ